MTRTLAVALLTLLPLPAAAASAADKAPPPLPMPPVAVRTAGHEGRAEPFPWMGVAVVQDPVNHETLYLCGHHGGAEFGSLGCWALAEDGKVWRELRSSAPQLDALGDKCQAARRPARDGTNAARQLRYAVLPAEQRARALAGEPARQLAQALKQAQEASAAVAAAAAKAHGWQAEALAHARPLLDRALDRLQTAAAGLAEGKLDAGPLTAGFAADWLLDEAAACLAGAPTPRYGAAAAYDPARKAVVLFGGSHGDYVASDTWIYDCPAKAWRQVWPAPAPAPRMEATLKWDDARKLLVLAGGQTVLRKVEYQKGYAPLPVDEWTFDAGTGVWACVGAEGAPAAGSAAGPKPAPATNSPTASDQRTYRTVCPPYDPRWYDSAPDADPAAKADWLAKLPANTWVNVPAQDRPAPERDWGTAAYSPDHDQIFRWTGGHCADPGNNVSTYFPAVNRWAIGYVPEIYRKGISFSGRPDCLNHTYLHYAYDPTSKRLVCTSMGGTGVYDPNRMDWDYTIAQPFTHHIYETCTVGTPMGVVVWTPGFFGLMDVRGRQWRKLPVTGPLPKSMCDGSAVCYDSKRNALWLTSYSGYQKANGLIWRYDLKSGEVAALTPANRETIGLAKGFISEIRECVYLPEADLVLYNNFVGGRQVAYDPAGNRWVRTNIAKLERLGQVCIGLVRDKRGLVWGMSNYKAIHVLRPQAETLQLTAD